MNVLIDGRHVGQGNERVIAGGLGLVLVGTMAIRLCRWYAGDGRYKTVWGAVAGRPFFDGRGSWNYGFWELCPDGWLAAAAMLTLIGALIVGVVARGRRSSACYALAGIVFVSGYLVNAVLLLKLMAEY